MPPSSAASLSPCGRDRRRARRCSVTASSHGCPCRLAEVDAGGRSPRGSIVVCRAGGERPCTPRHPRGVPRVRAARRQVVRRVRGALVGRSAAVRVGGASTRCRWRGAPARVGHHRTRWAEPRDGGRVEGRRPQGPRRVLCRRHEAGRSDGGARSRGPGRGGGGASARARREHAKARRRPAAAARGGCGRGPRGCWSPCAGATPACHRARRATRGKRAREVAAGVGRAGARRATRARNCALGGRRHDHWGHHCGCCQGDRRDIAHDRSGPLLGSSAASWRSGARTSIVTIRPTCPAFWGLEEVMREARRGAVFTSRCAAPERGPS